MSAVDYEFQALSNRIFKEGRLYVNENRGVKRLQVPSHTFRHNFLEDGFPALSVKELKWHSVVGELLWFLRGDTDIKFLRDNKINIWNQDAYNWYKREMKERELPIIKYEDWLKTGCGTVGRNYSAQWRSYRGVDKQGKIVYIDQIKNLVEGMKKDIMSSRLKVNAWNPAELEDTALPPCHDGFQIVGVPLTAEERFHVYKQWNPNSPGERASEISPERFDALKIPQFGFELHWNQRSVDTFLGLPFNIASYGLLAKILEVITGYPAIAIEGSLKCVHFYDNQFEVAQKLNEIDPFTHPKCELEITNREVVAYLKRTPNDKVDFVEILSLLNISDFVLEGYTSESAVSVAMLAPKE